MEAIRHYQQIGTTVKFLYYDHLWDCPKVVFKTTFGQSQGWSLIRGTLGVENNNLNFANKVFNRQDVLILGGRISGISLYLSKLSFPLSREAKCEILFQLAYWLQRRCLKMLMDDGRPTYACLYDKLIFEPSARVSLQCKMGFFQGIHCTGLKMLWSTACLGIQKQAVLGMWLLLRGDHK